MTEVETAQAEPAQAARAAANSPTVLERALGATAALALMAYCVWTQGVLVEDLLRPLPVAFVLAFVLGGLILSHGPHAIAQLLGVALGRAVPADDQRKALRTLCLRGRRLCYLGALLQMVARTVHLLQTLDSPAMIGPAIADMLAALVFAVLLGELGFGAAAHWVDKRG